MVTIQHNGDSKTLFMTHPVSFGATPLFRVEYLRNCIYKKTPFQSFLLKGDLGVCKGYIGIMYYLVEQLRLMYVKNRI